MPIDFATLLPRLDRGIRDGLGGKVRPELEKLIEVKIPRPYAAKLGQIAWRAGLPQLGLRVLNPIVRPREKAPVIASQEEQAEYAACLLKAGAWDEATLLLKNLSAHEVPNVWLYRAFAAVARWDYGGSIPLLEHYLAEKKLPGYQRLVGLVNLAAAFVHERRFLQSGPLLRQLLYQSSVQRSQLALGRVLELSAENFIEQKKWDRAETFLHKAELVLKESHGIDLFFVKKFRAVIAFRQGKRKELEEAREESRSRRHWETLRDLDRVQAIARRDDDLLAHLYYGTPFPIFRQELLRDSKGWQPAPEYRWSLGGESSRTRVLKVSEGKFEGKSEGIKEGQAVHRLLMILASDFYRPFRTATLCNHVYPDEHFHPEHSPTKLRQLLVRLREWLEEEKCGLSVSEESGHYHLEAEKPIILEIKERAKAVPLERSNLLVEQLREKFADGGFSSAQAADALGLNARSAQRLLEKAVIGELLVREGKGKNTRYHFKVKLPATGT